ncbi:hypothetical protein JMJ35_002925 [Cladonia borealis]|uniref:Dynein light chain n=1 Tax=Cladonia borealis TaxID=184061 RepID=A0AA39R3P9_9LECA|nr:hypothetical protein JMJ35_002925 [Cladonia borealis]
MSTSSTSTTSPSPIPLTRLHTLTHEILATVFPPTTTSYNHALTSSQNTEIINSLLGKILSEFSPSSGKGTGTGEGTGEGEGKGEGGYKWLVQSTIIQQTEEEGEGSVKRGMHSASGAYWNNERDGMWSCKWEGAEGRGFDVVVSVVWISVV